MFWAESNRYILFLELEHGICVQYGSYGIVQWVAFNFFFFFVCVNAKWLFNYSNRSKWGTVGGTVKFLHRNQIFNCLLSNDTPFHMLFLKVN